MLPKTESYFVQAWKTKIKEVFHKNLSSFLNEKKNPSKLKD